MALIQRVTRMFRADMHAVLDRLEEPDVLLKQAIREMGSSLQEQQLQLNRGSEELRQLQARGEQVEQQLTSLDQELDLCFNAGKDDLARAMVKRKLEAQTLQKFLTRKIEVTETQWRSLQTAYAENQKRLESMKQKAQLLCGEEHSAGANEYAGADCHVSDDAVEVALLREKQARGRS